jgi:hypothetical protein
MSSFVTLSSYFHYFKTMKILLDHFNLIISAPPEPQAAGMKRSSPKMVANTVRPWNRSSPTTIPAGHARTMRLPSGHMSVLPLPHSLQECSAVASSRCLRFGGKWH